MEESYSRQNKVSKILYGKGSTEVKKEIEISRNTNIHSNRDRDACKRNGDKSTLGDRSSIPGFNIFNTNNSNNQGYKSVRENNSSSSFIPKKNSINLEKQSVTSTAKTQLKFYINQTYKTHISANHLVIQNFGPSSLQSSSKPKKHSASRKANLSGNISTNLSFPRKKTGGNILDLMLLEFCKTQAKISSKSRDVNLPKPNNVSQKRQSFQPTHKLFCNNMANEKLKISNIKYPKVRGLLVSFIFSCLPEQVA